MNRRGFLDSILKAGVGAMILPAAVTYARTWKRPEPKRGRHLWLIDWEDLHVGIVDMNLKMEFYKLKTARAINKCDPDTIEIFTVMWGTEIASLSWLSCDSTS